jgi:large subunit ribosomal protein L25
MLERFRVLYGGDQPDFFSTRKSIQNLVYTPNAHTVVIDLGDGKSFTAKDISSPQKR